MTDVGKGIAAIKNFKSVLSYLDRLEEALVTMGDLENSIKEKQKELESVKSSIDKASIELLEINKLVSIAELAVEAHKSKLQKAQEVLN